MNDRAGCCSAGMSQFAVPTDHCTSPVIRPFTILRHAQSSTNKAVRTTTGPPLKFAVRAPITQQLYIGGARLCRIAFGASASSRSTTSRNRRRFARRGIQAFPKRKRLKRGARTRTDGRSPAKAPPPGMGIFYFQRLQAELHARRQAQPA